MRDNSAMSLVLSVGLYLICFGCSDKGGASQTDGGSDEDAGTDIIWEPAEQVDDWCDAVLAGSGSENDFVFDLSWAHSGIRLFTPSADFQAQDEALVGMLENSDPFNESRLAGYADASDNVCYLEAVDGALQTASVQMQGDVAVIQPGTGSISLPSGAAAVAIDLRQLPVGQDADDALDNAVGVALADDIEIGQRRFRRFNGHTDQYLIPNVYDSVLLSRTMTVVATGATDLPLVFWTGQRLSPHAAQVAGGLRLANRAWIVGYDVFSAVAESEWSGIGTGGLAWRSAYMQKDSWSPWPDRIPADIGTTTPENLLSEYSHWVMPADLAQVDATRAKMQQHDVSDVTYPEASTAAHRRAMLIVAHGLLRRFFTYFDVVGDTIDEALKTGLCDCEEIQDGDREATKKLLGRFMHEIHDGHGRAIDQYAEPVAGYLALEFQEINGEAVIRDSAHEDIFPGDAVVKIDGIDAISWFDEVMGYMSAATDGYLFAAAAIKELRKVTDSRELTLRDINGLKKTVTPVPMTQEETAVVPVSGTHRESGWLPDLGAEDLYFLNLNSDVVSDFDELLPHLEEMASANGVVVDMRNYPNFDHYALAEYLNSGPFTSAVFGIPTWAGPNQMEIVDEKYSFVPNDGAYTGPIVLLVSNLTISAAENFCQMFVSQDNVTVVGQQSAASNGNITGSWLPGGFMMIFTGMRILNPDGSQFHGIGIQPDVEVTPTPQEFADGIDPELMAAIDVLQTER